MSSLVKTTVKNDFLCEEMTVYTHKSGLTVYAVKKDLAGFHALFGTRYGSFDNVFTVDGETIKVPHGIAHFLEHKMFETADGRDSFELFSELGADANAYTSTDRTVYLFSCTSEFEKALAVLIDMVLTPVFTEKNVAKEQGIIAQEIKMCEDRPGDTVHYNLMRALYKENPVRIPIAGTVKSISEITPDLLYKCYRAFYRMSNMAICLCGNIDLDEIEKIFDKMIPLDLLPAPSFSEPECTESVNEPVINAYGEVASPIVSIGIKHPKAIAENLPACEILCEAVFGMCEDMYNYLLENELITSYQSYYEFSRSASYFGIAANVDEPEKVFDTVKEYVSKARTEGVNKDAFDRAKRKVYADFLHDFDSSETVAEAMMESFLSGSAFLDSAERYASVTHDEVNKLAKTVFAEEHIAMSALYPKSN